MVTPSPPPHTLEGVPTLCLETRPFYLHPYLLPLFLLAITFCTPHSAKGWENPPYATLQNPMKKESPVQVSKFLILTDPSRVNKSLSPEELAHLLQKTEQHIAASLNPPTESFTLILHTRISQKAKPKLQVSHQGDVSEETLQKIRKGLKKIPDVRSHGPLLRYEAHFAIESP